MTQPCAAVRRTEQRSTVPKDQKFDFAPAVLNTSARVHMEVSNALSHVARTASYSQQNLMRESPTDRTRRPH